MDAQNLNSIPTVKQDASLTATNIRAEVAKSASYLAAARPQAPSYFPPIPALGKPSLAGNFANASVLGTPLPVAPPIGVVGKLPPFPPTRLQTQVTGFPNVMVPTVPGLASPNPFRPPIPSAISPPKPVSVIPVVSPTARTPVSPIPIPLMTNPPTPTELTGKPSPVKPPVALAPAVPQSVPVLSPPPIPPFLPQHKSPQQIQQGPIKPQPPRGVSAIKPPNPLVPPKASGVPIVPANVRFPIPSTAPKMVPIPAPYIPIHPHRLMNTLPPRLPVMLPIPPSQLQRKYRGTVPVSPNPAQFYQRQLVHKQLYSGGTEKDEKDHEKSKEEEMIIVREQIPHCHLAGKYAVQKNLPKPFELQNFHRPKRNFPDSEISVTVAPEEDIKEFKEKSHLSSKSGNIILVEYIEQYPPLLTNFGMAAKIKTYFQKKSLDDNPTDVPVRGELVMIEPFEESPFAVEIPPKSHVVAFENNLCQVPIYQHNANEEDFLLVYDRETNTAYIREIPSLNTAGAFTIFR